MHLTYINGTSVTVSWATGNGTFTNGPLEAGNVTNPYGPLSTVNISTDSSKAFPVTYGTDPAALNGTATGTLVSYRQIYTGEGPQRMFHKHSNESEAMQQAGS